MPLPVISVAQMREWERVTWAGGVKEDDVMRQAGRAVARQAEAMTRPGDFVFFLAGKGHNGDDAAYAYNFIENRERALLRVVDPENAVKDVQRHLKRSPALIVDGLFGIGLNRSLAAAWIRFLDAINASRRPLLAVDVPSGLHSDTGLPLDNAIRATCTLTLGAVKQGLVKTHAAPFVGRLLVVADIGLAPYPFDTELSLTTAADFANYPPPRVVSGHKGTFGHVALLAGSPGYHGAAVLAARGAQRAQPGLVSLLTHESVYLPVAAQLQAVMVHGHSGDPALPANGTAVVVGPGLADPRQGEPIQRAVRKLWQDSPLPVLADASALDWLPDGPCARGALRVITPHPGEAARMLQKSAADVQNDRPKALRELSRRWGNCFVVLKGHQTLIGRGKEDLVMNNSGNPHLAQGGSGDVLAGYLGGLLAQPELQAQPGLTLRYGVWQHGAAADALQASQPGFTVEELAAALGSVRP
jgi:NAD(P)H-hydrate epimerase